MWSINVSPIFRTFRNYDSPALARLWNARQPAAGAACAAKVHELDAHAWGGLNFEAGGLTVAELDGEPIGFVHAGFGPDHPIPAARPLELSHEIGAIAQLVVRPDHEHSDLASQLIQRAERYLRARGARVIYAGSLFPLNPFYWGVAGGSEGSGITSREHAFLRAIGELGYQPSSTTLLLEADLDAPEPRDPRAAVIRRQTRVDYIDDASPADWWEALALGEFQMMRAELASKTSGVVVASAVAWDMSWFSRVDGRARVGLIKVEVVPAERRRGHGRFLLAEIFRRLRENQIQVVSTQTASTNLPALGLYNSLGFEIIDQSTLFRLPAELLDRSRPDES